LEIWQNNNEKAFSGETIQNEVKFKVGEDEKFIYNIISPIKRKEIITGILGVNIDITSRKKAEKELNKLNQLKTEIINRTSHELRTPLVSIKGFTELILTCFKDKLNKEIYSIIERIEVGCSRLEELINDIIIATELKSDLLRLEKVKYNISELISACVDRLRKYINQRDHQITLNLNPNLIINIEKKTMKKALYNIISNAIKYTPPNGKIDIESKFIENKMIISFKDNGIGFSEDEKNKIFKRFGKIERYGQGMDILDEGSGFGLYITKKIIELHSGNIWRESEGRMKGTTFFISLPISEDLN